MTTASDIYDLRDFADTLGGELTILSHHINDDSMLNQQMLQWHSILNDSIHELELVRNSSLRSANSDKVAQNTEALELVFKESGHLKRLTFLLGKIIQENQIFLNFLIAIINMKTEKC